MQKATLLTLALSVSALFASAQTTSLKTFESGKVYSIKNKHQSVYAAAMPQTSNMACTAQDKLDLSCLFTITPVEGSTGVYTIKPYADDTKVVYSIEVGNADNTVGIKTDDNAADTKWKIADAPDANFVTITSNTSIATNGYWNYRGINADWNLAGIGGYVTTTLSGSTKKECPGSFWTIAEVTPEEIATAKEQFKTYVNTIYNNITEDQIKEQVGYYSQTLVDEVKSNFTNAADGMAAYKAAKSLAQLINLPVDGGAYKMYGLFKDGTKAYLKSNGKDVFIMQKQADGKYKIVSSKADEENFIYTGQNHQAGKKVSLFDIKVRHRINFGALNLVTGEKFTANVCIKKDGSTLNQYSSGSDNTTTWSTEWYFEEATDYAGHEVTLTQSSDGKAYATLNLPFATTIPEGVTAYKKVDDTGASVKLEEYKPTNNVLPANTPVLLQAAKTLATFVPAAYVAKDETTGFNGTLAAAPVAGNAYILAMDGAAVKFCRLSATNNKVNANKAYLVLPAISATALNFDFGGVATGIENAVAEKANNAPIYDLSGRRVMNAVKGGIYIQNGKKFVK